jgi:3-phosphoshikimate 1-carboxyvinyltransferase
MDKTVKKVKKASGTIELPGDNSISHRALILASLADDVSEIYGCSDSLEVETTKKILNNLGVEISGDVTRLEVKGKGIDGYSAPESVIDAGSSPAALYLFTGLLSAFEFDSEIDTSDLLKRRSYSDLIETLVKMGANIQSENGIPPFKISASHLLGIEYSIPTSSPLLKSAVLLAALLAEGETVIRESIPSRDHTERMINHFSIPMEIYSAEDSRDQDDLDRRMKRIKQKQMFREKGSEIHIWGAAGISPARVDIPGDITLSAPFITLATILKNSNLKIKNVGFNPTRSGFVDLVKRMGANFSFSSKREMSGEPVIDIGVRTASLRGRRLGGAIVHNMIDEIPTLAVLASQSEGTTVIREADELRHKEIDRLHATFVNLRKMGAKVGELNDGLVIDGKSNLRGAEVDCMKDDRLVMAFAIAALVADGETLLKNVDGVENSYTGFWDVIDKITDGTAFG